MDDIDRKLVTLLQTDSKKTLQELSQILNKPKTTIAARIKKLEESGVIIGHKAVVNPFALGYRLLAFVLVSVKRGVGVDTKPLQHTVAEKILRDSGGGDMPFVEEAFIITGPYDVLFKVWARDIKQLSSFLVAYLASSPEIQRTETLIVLEIVEDWRKRIMPPVE